VYKPAGFSMCSESRSTVLQITNCRGRIWRFISNDLSFQRIFVGKLSSSESLFIGELSWLMSRFLNCVEKYRNGGLRVFLEKAGISLWYVYIPAVNNFVRTR
jgi:hypothetical protein